MRDLGKSIISVDYFEDLLSPSVTTYLKISDTANIYNDYQLRGYERLDLEIATSNGKETFAFTDERPFVCNWNSRHYAERRCGILHISV